MKKSTLLFAFVFMVSTNSFSQNKLDSTISTLYNKDLQIGSMPFPSVRFSSISKPTLTRNLDSTKNVKKYYTVASLIDKHLNIDTIVKTYSKPVVIKKLVECLQDTTRDFYAHALLLEITGNDKKLGNYFFNPKREDWVKTTRDADIKYWHSYLVGEK